MSGYRETQAGRPASSKSSTQEALDVARYVADMTAQLEAMAVAARLDMLGYFLGMAKAESELLLRTSAGEAPEDAQSEVEVTSSFD